MRNHFLFNLILVVILLSSFGLKAQEKEQIQKPDSVLIQEFIAKKRAFNKEFGYGFRIQLYNGFEVEAKKIQAKFKLDYPDLKTYLVYRQPEWKIQVGHYKTKLEADRNLLNIKKDFPYAIVVPLGK